MKTGKNYLMSAAHNRYRRMKKMRTLSRSFALGAGILLPFVIGATPMATGAAPELSGKWQVVAPENADTLTLSLRAENEVKGWMKSHVPVLTIQCIKGKPTVYIETGMPLEVTQVDKQHIRIGLDNNKPYPQRWREKGNATVFANPSDSETLIKQLLQTKKFVFEFIPFSSPRAQAEFTVAGLAAYSPRITKLCW